MIDREKYITEYGIQIDPLFDKIDKLEDSRDALLQALKQYPEGELERVYIGTKFVHVSKIIERAEAMKEKETK